MIKEEAIVITLPIIRTGERVYFQKSLPKDTRRIIGLEYGAILVNGLMLPPVIAPPFRIMPDKIIGRLTLQVPGKEGIFFHGDLVEERNFHIGDTVTASAWQPVVWTHGGKKEEIELAVNGNTSFIEGLFIDSYSKGEIGDLQYQLNLYLWIEKSIP